MLRLKLLNFYLFRSIFAYNLMNMDAKVINDQFERLFNRLDEAERRSENVKEIKDIRMDIKRLKNILKLEPNLCSTQFNNEGFNTEDLVDESKNPKRRRLNVPMEDNGYVVVYVDGACENNGQSNAKAGIGVWFEDNHPLNISKPVVGRATNNTAEIQAATAALEMLKKFDTQKVLIKTDSQFVINCITKWIQTWKVNNWKTAKGTDVINRTDLEKLDQLCNQFADIKWEYIPGHKGITGNEEADKLARRGAACYKKVY